MLNKELHCPNLNFYQTVAQNLPNNVTSVQGINPYKDLNRFRDEMATSEIAPYYQIYEKHKKSALLYQTIFIGMGVLFALLFTYIGFQKTNWICNSLLAGCFMTKTSLYAICGLFSASSFLIASRIRPQKEAVQHLMRMAKYKLLQLYKKRLSGIGIKGFFVFCEDHKAVAGLRHDYQETLEKMSEIKETTLSLLSHIAKAEEIEKEQRILLYNQALLELRDKLNSELALFKN